MSKHIAVLKGGWSAEREVSLRSGAACAKALREVGYQVTEIDVGRDIAQQLAEVKPDVVFNALHGNYGEDGCVQGLLKSCKFPIPIRACWHQVWRWISRWQNACLKPLVCCARKG